MLEYNTGRGRADIWLQQVRTYVEVEDKVCASPESPRLGETPLEQLTRYAVVEIANRRNS